jgi:hypothetical protein
MLKFQWKRNRTLWAGIRERRPTGKTVAGLSSRFSKNIPLPALPKSSLKRRRPVSTEGRFAIVTNAGRDAMDAGGAKDERACLADGEDVWF